MIEYRETREYSHNIGETIQAHYLEVIEKTSEDEDGDENQEANKSTDSQGLHEWDYWNSDDEQRLYSSEEEEYEIEDYYKEVKRFSELNKEEIDIVAEKIRRISPKFEDLFRPEKKEVKKIGNMNKKWKELQQEVKTSMQ